MSGFIFSPLSSSVDAYVASSVTSAIDAYFASSVNFGGNVIVSGQIANSQDSYMSPSGAIQTINWNLGNAQILNLGNGTGVLDAYMSNYKASGTYVLTIIQTYATARTIVWVTPPIKWAGGTAPTVSSGAGNIDIFSFYYDGLFVYGSAIQNMS